MGCRRSPFFKYGNHIGCGPICWDCSFLFLNMGTSVVSSLFAAGYAFDFSGDPRLVEACRGEFAGDVLFL